MACTFNDPLTYPRNGNKTIKWVLERSELDCEFLYDENNGEWKEYKRNHDYSNAKKAVWRYILDRWNGGDIHKELLFAMVMNLLTVHKWETVRLQGSVQDETRYVVYDTNSLSGTDINNYESELYNMCILVKVYWFDNNPPDSLELIDKDGELVCIHNNWNLEKIREEICVNMGCDDDSLVYIDSGNNFDLPAVLMA